MKPIGNRSKHISLRRIVAGLALSGMFGLASAAPQRPTEGVGALLYESNCQTCHIAQVHWREKRVVKDWGTLLEQVGRWQNTLGLRWNDEQIGQVARYLNFRYYKFNAPQKALNDGVPVVSAEVATPSSKPNRP